jgi:hypothetical protein
MAPPDRLWIGVGVLLIAGSDDLFGTVTSTSLTKMSICR